MSNNYKIFIFFLLSIFALFPVQAQRRIHVQGCIKGLPSSRVLLAEQYAGRAKIIDSVAVVNGCFDFSENDTLKQGLYYIILNEEHSAYFQLILSGQDVSLRSVYTALSDSMDIQQSFENKMLFDYIKQTQQSNRRVASLQQSGVQLTSDNQAEISYLKEKDARLAKDIIGQYPKTLLATILKAEQPIEAPAGLSQQEKDNYFWVHYFDNTDLDNTALIRTYIMSNMMVNYLAHYENKAYSFNEQVENYAIAIDSILDKTKGHTAMHDFYEKELADKYRYGDLDILCAYTEEYYSKPKEESCESESAPLTTAKERLAAMKHATVGTKAPEIVMPTYDGKQTSLATISSDYVLIVFWSSYCYHCTQMLPKIKQIYDHRKNNNLEVLAVSMDTDEASWTDFVKAGGYSWLNYCDLNGWKGTIPKNFNVQGTPTYILLNKDRTIISKPATLELLAEKLKSLDLF